MVPNPNEQGSGGSSSAQRDMVFGLAQEASSGGGDGEGSDEQVRRTITMVTYFVWLCKKFRVEMESFLPIHLVTLSRQYQNGFIVDDGPYRRLDDPANGEFLRALALGRTPRELVESTDGTTPASTNIVVGLIDKRSEDYVEPFRSFSGAGSTLGGGATTASTDGVFDPNTLPSTPSETSDGESTTNIAVRLPNGKRKIVKIALSATITDLAIQLRDDAEQASFRLSSGFPPQPITDVALTIENAGLKGAQISMQKV